jgi:hypothetical protein
MRRVDVIRTGWRSKVMAGYISSLTLIFTVERPTCFEQFHCLCAGVLLLNAVLTVRAHNANSHKDQGWEQLTDAVVKHISDNSRNVVFLLWGSYAQKKVAAVDKVLVSLLVCVRSWRVCMLSDVLCGMGILF